MLRVLINCDEEVKGKARYVLSTFLDTLGTEYCFEDYRSGEFSDSFFIYYGNLNDKGYKQIKARNKVIGIMSSRAALSYFSNREKSEPNVAYFDYGDFTKVPILLQEGIIAGEIISFEEGLFAEVRVDIVLSSFYLLSCWQEFANDKRDRYGRFPYSESIQFRLGIIDRPIVTEYMLILKSLLKGVFPDIPFKPIWPEDKDFAVCLTHDVDFTKKYSLVNAHRRIIKIFLSLFLQRFRDRASIKDVYELAGSLLFGRDPYFTFDEIMVAESKYNFISTFYFIAQKQTYFEPNYSLEDKGLRDLIRKIEKNGCEIGIHGSHFAYRDEASFGEQLTKLKSVCNSEIIGNRNHYLKLDILKTFEVLEKNGIKYDSTLGFAEHIGYRNSFGFPFFPYSIKEDKKYDLLEIPLTIMDFTLAWKDYMNIRESNRIIDLIIEYMEKLKESSSCTTLLVHNSHLKGREAGGWSIDLYKTLLGWIHRNNGWATSGREIIDWWNGRIEGTFSQRC